MLKRTLLVLNFCILISGVCKSQQYKFIYYLDADFGTVSKSKATYIGKGFYEDKLFRLDCFYPNWNSPKVIMHFTDSSLAKLEGAFKNFHVNGKIIEEGNYLNSVEEGTWFKYDSLGKKTDSIFYKNGLPYVVSTYGYHKDGNLIYYTNKDSLKNTFQTFSYKEDGSLNSEVFFTGQRGILKRYTEAGLTIDSLFTREEKEATFPGGENGWREYLKKNLNPSVPAEKGAPSGRYKVIIKFIVTKDGSLTDIFAETYQGYGMEQEVIRIIKDGPRWIPAVQYGRNVNAYRRQPVTFFVEN